MFLFLHLTPTSIVVVENRTTTVQPSFNRPQITSPQIQSLQDQFSSILLNSERISTKIDALLKKRVNDKATVAYDLIYTPMIGEGDNATRLDKKNWVSIGLQSENTKYYGQNKKIGITVQSDNWLRDEIKSELENYSFALYRFSKSGYDSMSWHKPFDKKHYYSYSIELDPDKIGLNPSADFKATVRRNYFQENSPDGAIAVLIFRKDKIGTNDLDYLLVYDF